MGANLAEVLRRFGPAYLRDHPLSTPQARAWRAIVACRTPSTAWPGSMTAGCTAR
jgi:hypothetical protein